MVANILKPESLPNDTEHTVRQGCYMLAVRIICFLLAGRIPSAVCTNIENDQHLVLNSDCDKALDANLSHNETDSAVAKNVVQICLETISGPSKIEVLCNHFIMSFSLMIKFINMDIFNTES